MKTSFDPRILDILDRVRQSVPESYVVGGTVRDLLMEGRSPQDVDVAVPAEGLLLAKSIASLPDVDAAYVPLDDRRGTARLVLRQFDGPTIDISSFKGKTIGEDLRNRDFTINALALKLDHLLSGDTDHIVDPLGGMNDLRQRTIRACAESSFQDDPLRILRAYRFAAMLGFRISRSTERLMEATVTELPRISGERVRDELVALLTLPHSHPVLKKLDRSGIVQVLFPEVIAMRGCEQNEYHHLDVWGHTLETVNQMESILEHPEEIFGSAGPVVADYGNEVLVGGRRRKVLLKLAALFHDTGKPSCRSIDLDGRVRFIGHEQESEKLFARIAHRLRLSSKEDRIVRQWIGGHMRLMFLLGAQATDRALYRLYRNFGGEILGLIVLFCADLGATRGPARTKESEARALEYANHAVAHILKSFTAPVPKLVTGHDLLAKFDLEPGPAVGALLERVAEAQACGEVSTKEDALRLVRRYLEDR